MTTVSSTSTPYTTVFPSIIDPGLDVFLGVICTVSCVIGSLGNTLALVYFCLTVSRRDLPSIIYIMMSITDLITSISLFPAIQGFWAFQRSGTLFKVPWLCYTWGLLWCVLPYFSVFLVLVLSVVRTRCLMSPFQKINQSLTYGVIFGYLIYLVLRIVIPLGLKKTIIHYLKSQVMCVILPNLPIDEVLLTYYRLSNAAQLALPLLPIIISCVLSCYSVWMSGRMSACSRSNVQKQATVTIITITIIYIVFNVPVFVAYLAHILEEVFQVIQGTRDGVFRWYGWTYVFVISVCMNAAINPIIYFFRIKKIRLFYRSALRNRKLHQPASRKPSIIKSSVNAITRFYSASEVSPRTRISRTIIRNSLASGYGDEAYIPPNDHVLIQTSRETLVSSHRDSSGLPIMYTCSEV